MSGFEKINDMNYRVADDGECTSITKTDSDVDDYSVYATLREAKQQAKLMLRDEIKGLRMAMQKIRRLKADDLEIE